MNRRSPSPHPDDIPMPPPGAPVEDRFESALLRDDPFELQDLIAEVALESDARVWAECSFAQLTKHRSAEVRGTALRGFGHLARRFGILDPNRVRRLIENGLHSQHEFIRGEAESAADDVETFLAWRFDRPAKP